MRLKKSYAVILIAILLLFAQGCRYTRHGELIEEKDRRIDLIKLNNQAADNLLTNCNIVLDKERPVIVTSLVNVDKIQKSSTYGRMSGEIIASRIAQQGYNVKEIKLSQTQIFVKEREGELALSRQIKQIAHKHDVQGMVVGTYAIGQADIHISLRLISTMDNRIACAHCYTIPKKSSVNLWR